MIGQGFSNYTFFIHSPHDDGKKANCDSVLGWGLEKYDKKMGDLSHTRHHHPTVLGWIFLTNATYYMVEAQFLFRHLKHVGI